MLAQHPFLLIIKIDRERRILRVRAANTGTQPNCQTEFNECAAFVCRLHISFRFSFKRETGHKNGRRRVEIQFRLFNCFACAPCHFDYRGCAQSNCSRRHLAENVRLDSWISDSPRLARALSMANILKASPSLEKKNPKSELPKIFQSSQFHRPRILHGSKIAQNEAPFFFS